jgi:SAM-dependent methyltransferase
VRIPAACAAALLAALWLAAPQAEAQRGAGDVVYVPTPQPVVEVMLEMAAVGPADTVIDLGSGDGRVVVTAAAKHGARGVGVELDRYLLKLAADNARRAGVADRVRFLEQDLFETDISGATVVTLYLLPEMNQRLQPRLLALRPGARVVIHDYPLERWSPDARRVIPVPGKTVGHPGESHLFLHVVPARLAGEWQARAGSGGEATVYEFAFEQEFQYVEGTVRGRGQTARIPEFRLAGDRFDFAFELTVAGRPLAHRLKGEVRNGLLEGTLATGEGAARRELPVSARLVKAGAINTGEDRPPRQYRHLKQ